MNVRQLRELLSTKPYWMTQDEFDSLEAIVILGDEFTGISDIEESGVLGLDANNDSCLIFSLIASCAEDDLDGLSKMYEPEDQINEPDVTDELSFLCKRNNDQNPN